MKVSNFDYKLPEELIAQSPLKTRSDSRLLVLDKESGNISHEKFDDIINYFEAGDSLVLNDTKVIPARLIGKKEDTGAIIELLLLKNTNDKVWEALVKPAKRIKVETVVVFGEGLLKAKCIVKKEEGLCEFELIYDGVLYELLDKLGTMPLPPYIHKQLADQSRYQTVYAKNTGSAAAPTAGLHFTPELLASLKEKGVNITYLTLHVGLGTFRPVMTENIEEHKMHSEYYVLSDETVRIINETKTMKKRLVVVGTTSIRVLESVMNKFGYLKADSATTDIFIYPGYKFKIVDNLITNFHLPQSTLIMLVSSLAGKENIMKAYEEAIKEKYRFFSFGDAMFIKGGKNE